MALHERVTDHVVDTNPHGEQPNETPLTPLVRLRLRSRRTYRHCSTVPLQASMPGTLRTATPGRRQTFKSHSVQRIWPIPADHSQDRREVRLNQGRIDRGPSVSQVEHPRVRHIVRALYAVGKKPAHNKTDCRHTQEADPVRPV